jgi:hypothetical protein
MGRLISITVDEDDLIEQYNWLCEEAELHNAADDKAGSSEIIGLQNFLESIMMGLWGNVLIYDNGGDSHDRYLVYLPGHSELYSMSHDADSPNGVCTLISVDGDGLLEFTELDNGDMVPVGYMEEVSIINVAKGTRRKILELISDELAHYEQFMIIT